MGSSSHPGRINCLLQFGRGSILSLAVLFLTPAILWAQQRPVATDAERNPTTSLQASAETEDVLQYAVYTGSPREVLASFQRLSEQFEGALNNYKETHDRKRADRIALVVEQWLSLIDLSKVPQATRRAVGAETATYLLDIFNRISLPALEDVPDATAFNPDSPASFPIPNTPSKIVRIDNGPRQDEFLFSAHTVLSAPTFHRHGRKSAAQIIRKNSQLDLGVPTIDGADGAGCALQCGA